jgi:hypothetical protein
MAQPNFAAMAQSHLALSEQPTLCENIPAVNGGAAILVHLDNLANELRDGFTSIRSDIAGLRLEIDARLVFLDSFL